MSRAPAPPPAPETPISALGRDVYVGDHVEIARKRGGPVGGVYIKRGAYADRGRTRDVVVIRERVTNEEREIPISEIVGIAKLEVPEPREKGPLEYGGRRWTIRGLANELGIPHPTFDQRLRRNGFDVERAIGGK